MKPAIIICASSATSFAASLSLFTEVGYCQKILQQQYPLRLKNVEYLSAGAAYLALSVNLNVEQKFELMIEILRAKLEQINFLAGVIAVSGGVEWLRSCSYTTTNLEPIAFWNGTGYNSAFITALIAAYRQINSAMLNERQIVEVDLSSEAMETSSSTLLTSRDSVRIRSLINLLSI